MALSRWRAVALIVALALAAGVIASLARDPDALGSITTLTVVDGGVFVRHGDASFEPAREGDLVSAGDTVRTATGASAEITYFEGSSVRVESDAEIVLMSLRTSEGGVLQTLGRAWDVVTKLISGESRYELRAPSSTASVRG